MAGARGESTLTLPGGREIRLLYTNRALMDAERRLGRGIVQVLSDFMGGGGSLSDTAVLLQVGMQAARREDRRDNPSVIRAEAQAIMDEAGFATTVTAVMEGVAVVLSYGTENREGGVDESDAPPA